MQHFFEKIVDAFFPAFCVNCQSDKNLYRHFLCLKCQQEIKLIKTQVCPRCGRISPAGQFCPGCRQEKLFGVIVGAKFKPPVSELIHWCKYNKMQGIADFLAELLTPVILKENLVGDLIIVPVPVNLKKYLERGFNQADLLADGLSRRLKIKRIRVLKKIKETESQMKLGRRQRLENLTGSFACRNTTDIKGKTILLVDDVMTTGATLLEGAKVLRIAGARRIYGVVVAHGK